MNRLSFLNLVFIPPAVSLVLTALPLLVSAPPRSSPYSFPRVAQDSMLWHRRFGHIGMEATRATLTKDYVTGVHLEGSFIHDQDRTLHCTEAFHSRNAYSVPNHSINGAP